MHFGRVSTVDQTLLKLPADSQRTENFLQLPRIGDTRFYLGCPIWGSPLWVGDIYPQKTKPGEFLQHYSTYFNAVEVNSTFYHLLNEGKIRQWTSQVSNRFRFCPKAFRGITENLSSPDLPNLIKKFCNNALSFDKNLGIVFAQFSERFSPQQFPLLKNFLEQWPQEIPLAIELRHPQWFNHHTLPDELINFFYRLKIATVITDTAGRRDALHLSLTQPKVLIRFQGNNTDSSDFLRLDEWKIRLKKWMDRSLNEIYFFAHQPEDHFIPKTAQYLQTAFEEHFTDYLKEQKNKIAAREPTELLLF